MNHVEKYKRQIGVPSALGPNDYIRSLHDDDYLLIGIEGIIELYESLLAIEHYRFNGPMHVSEKAAYLERVRKTSFYSRMRLHIAVRNLTANLKRALFGRTTKRKARK